MGQAIGQFTSTDHLSSKILLHGASLWDLSCPALRFSQTKDCLLKKYLVLPLEVHPSPTTKQPKASVCPMLQCFKNTSNL